VAERDQGFSIDHRKFPGRGDGPKVSSHGSGKKGGEVKPAMPRTRRKGWETVSPVKGGGNLLGGNLWGRTGTGVKTKEQSFASVGSGGTQLVE